MDITILSKLLVQLQRLRQQDRWTRAQLEAYQARELERLRHDAYDRSPFYQRFHHGKMDAPLQQLPVLTKAMMMEHFDELVTDRSIRLQDAQDHLAGMQSNERFLRRYWVNATSGSTGKPGVFLSDSSEWVSMLASFARAREWAGLKVGLLNPVKTALIASNAPWHLSTSMGKTIGGRLMPELHMAVDEPLETIVTRLNEWQPDMLIAYTSMAGILADEQEAGRLHIAPRLVYTSAELLTPDVRRRVERTWGQVLFNEYAATETGCFAAECNHHIGMHLFEDQCVVEVVDEQNRPVPPGTYGAKMLITVLFRHTQPLIRYELSDSVQLAGHPLPCTYPFALITNIQGRREDELPFPTKDGSTKRVNPLLFSRLMDTAPVGQWQVLQERDALAILVVNPREGFVDAALEATIRQALVAEDVVVPPVVVRRMEGIPRGKTGKAALITSQITTA